MLRKNGCSATPHGSVSYTDEVSTNYNEPASNAMPLARFSFRAPTLLPSPKNTHVEATAYLSGGGVQSRIMASVMCAMRAMTLTSCTLTISAPLEIDIATVAAVPSSLS